jgi:NAD(P)-dependent dehydrogenase (short-subunit alcohol dehydrogenase family)
VFSWRTALVRPAVGDHVSPLAGRLALVTGGTRGIGAAIAARLASDGARVTVTGSRPDGTSPGGWSYEAVDFSDPIATERYAAALTGRDVDILINNAGINRIAPFEAIATDDFDRIHAVNLRAPFMLCRAVLPGMRRRRWGRIVNIASIFGTISKEWRASYSASKFGLDGMTAALAAEVACDGVLANCVSPGFIDTELTRTVLSEAERLALAQRVPMKRFGLPEEIAALVAWLAGPENTYISGQNLVIDGGFTRV